MGLGQCTVPLLSTRRANTGVIGRLIPIYRKKTAFFSQDSDREEQFDTSRLVTFDRSRSANLETINNLPTASCLLLCDDVRGTDISPPRALDRSDPLHAASRLVIGEDFSGNEFNVNLHCGDMLYSFHTGVLFSRHNDVENEVFIHGDFGEQYFPNINDDNTSIGNNALIDIGDNSSTNNNNRREREVISQMT